LEFDKGYKAPGFKAVSDKIYVVTSNGNVEQKGYEKGKAKVVLEKLSVAQPIPATQ
jgi:hypothetical protein